MKTILLDTSFLIACAEFHIDYLTEIHRICDFEYALALPDIVINELNHLVAAGTFKQKQAARLALTVVRAHTLQLIPSPQALTADDALLVLATKNTLVATIDAELKRKLKLKKIPVIVIRQKKYLILQY